MPSIPQKSAIPDQSQTFSQPNSSPQTIVASNVQRGDGDLLATCDLKIGGIFIRGIRVRRGRRDSVFINFPSIRRDDIWINAIEITSRPLEEAVRQAVLSAVSAVLR